MPTARTHCRHCNKKLPEGGHAARKYCGDACRVAFNRRLNKGLSKGGRKKMPEHIKEIRRLAFNVVEDEVREVLRDEVRAQIEVHTRDNILQLATRMTGLAPKVLDALSQDLESRDEIVRSRAYALWLKYMMTFARKDKDEDARAPVTVVFGGDFNGEIRADGSERPDSSPPPPMNTDIIEVDASEVDDEPRLLIEGVKEEAGILGVDVIEDFEADWPSCNYCHQRKHPDAIHFMSGGVSGQEKAICSSCRISIEYRKGRRDPTAIADDSLFGTPDKELEDE